MKTYFVALALLAAQPSFAFDRHEVELVSQYVRTHENVTVRSIYQGLTSLSLVPFILPRSGVPQWGNLVSLGLFAIFAPQAMQYYWSGGKQGYYAFRLFDLELGAPSAPHRDDLGVQFTSEDVKQVRSYLDEHRKPMARLFHQGIIAISTFSLGVSLPRPFSALTSVAAVALLADAVTYTGTNGNLSILNKYLDRAMGMPPAPNVEKVLTNLAHLSTDEAGQYIDANPEAARVVRVVARLLRPPK